MRRAIFAWSAIVLLAACTSSRSQDAVRGNGLVHINYVELASSSTELSKRFYAQAFDWKFVDYGSTYAGTENLPTNIGLEAEGASFAPLPVIEVGDLEAALARVETAGGVIVQPIFAFPGGRRFEFTDPSGNRLAVTQPET